jgi:hypothetical protein
MSKPKWSCIYGLWKSLLKQNHDIAGGDGELLQSKTAAIKKSPELVVLSSHSSVFSFRNSVIPCKLMGNQCYHIPCNVIIKLEESSWSAFYQTNFTTFCKCPSSLFQGTDPRECSFPSMVTGTTIQVTLSLEETEPSNCFGNSGHVSGWTG